MPESEKNWEEVYYNQRSLEDPLFEDAGIIEKGKDRSALEDEMHNLYKKHSSDTHKQAEEILN